MPELYNNIFSYGKIISYYTIHILIIVLTTAPGYTCDINLSCASVTDISIIEFPIHNYDDSYYTMYCTTISVDTSKIDIMDNIDTCKDLILNFKSGNYIIHKIDPSKPQSLKFPPSQGELYYTQEIVIVFFNSKSDAAEMAKLICGDKLSSDASSK